VHCHAASASYVVVSRRHRILSLRVLIVTCCDVDVSRRGDVGDVDEALPPLRPAFLHVVVVVSCRCALSSSSDKADAFF